MSFGVHLPQFITVSQNLTFSTLSQFTNTESLIKYNYIMLLLSNSKGGWVASSGTVAKVRIFYIYSLLNYDTDSLYANLSSLHQCCRTRPLLGANMSLISRSVQQTDDSTAFFKII